MAEIINKELIKINTTVVPKSFLTKYRLGYMTLWGDDTGRDLEGDENGTLKGIYPKIFISIKSLTSDEMEWILNLLNLVTFDLTYYDPQYKDYRTLPNYRADFEIDLLSTKSGKFRGFDVNIIPRKKRV